MKYTKYELWDVVGKKNYYQWTLSWLDRFLDPTSILVPKMAKVKGSEVTPLQSHLLDGQVIAIGTEWGNKNSTTGQDVLDVKLKVDKEHFPPDILINAVSAYISPEENADQFLGIIEDPWFKDNVEIHDADIENDLKNRAKYVIDNSDVVVSIRKNDEVPRNLYKKDLDRIDPVEILTRKIDPDVWVTGDEVYHHIAASGFWLFMRLDEPGKWIITVSNYSPRFGGGQGAIYHGKSTYSLEVNN